MRQTSSRPPGAQKVSPLKGAECPALDQPPGFTHLDAGPLLEGDSQQATALLSLGDHPVRLGYLDRDRLLDEDVLSSTQASDGQLGVERVRRQDDRDVRRFGEERRNVRVDRAAEFIADLPGALAIGVVDADDVGANRAKASPVRREDVRPRANDHDAQGRHRTDPSARPCRSRRYENEKTTRIGIEATAASAISAGQLMPY